MIPILSSSVIYLLLSEKLKRPGLKVFSYIVGIVITVLAISKTQYYNISFSTEQIKILFYYSLCVIYFLLNIEKEKQSFNKILILFPLLCVGRIEFSYFSMILLSYFLLQENKSILKINISLFLSVIPVISQALEMNDESLSAIYVVCYIVLFMKELSDYMKNSKCKNNSQWLFLTYITALSMISMSYSNYIWAHTLLFILSILVSIKINSQILKNICFLSVFSFVLLSGEINYTVMALTFCLFIVGFVEEKQAISKLEKVSYELYKKIELLLFSTLMIIIIKDYSDKTILYYGWILYAFFVNFSIIKSINKDQGIQSREIVTFIVLVASILWRLLL